MKTIHFEDNGQDLIEMDIDDTNTIIACRSVNMGKYFNKWHVEPDSIRVGQQLRVIGRGYFRHRIERIEQFPDPVIITEHDEEIEI